MASSPTQGRDRDDVEFLRLAATRVILPGARLLERRLVPEEGYTLEEDREQGVIYLKQSGGGSQTTISCECGLEGGSCVPIVIDDGEIGEYGACIPDAGCGSSGLFCFMGLNFGGGLSLKIKA